MFAFARTAARWVGRHSLPAAAGAVLVVGAVGGGIGYTLAGQHAAAAPSSSTASANHVTAPAVKGRNVAAASRGQKLIDGALNLLATQTGQSVASIRSQLAAGKSIDDIAGAQAPAIENEIIAAITKLADKAVKTGKISAAQESAALATAKTRVNALMAEPGTQLIKDVEKFLQFLQAHAARGAPASAAASPRTSP